MANKNPIENKILTFFQEAPPEAVLAVFHLVASTMRKRGLWNVRRPKFEVIAPGTVVNHSVETPEMIQGMEERGRIILGRSGPDVPLDAAVTTYTMSSEE